MTALTTRKRSIAVVTTLLGLLTIVATAGTYANSTGSRGAGGVISGGTAGVNQPPGLPAWFVENLMIVIVGGSIAIALAIVVGTAVFKGREGLRRLAKLGAQLGVAGAAGFLLFFGAKALIAFFSSGRPTAGGPPGGSTGGGTPVQGAGGVAGGGGAVPTAIGLTAVVVALLLVGYFLLRREPGEEGGAAPGASGEPMPVDAEDAGTQGPAIDIDDVPRTNAVYRAWHDMARRAVDASDRTATPSEIARAAVRSGFDRQAVHRLTELFEEVRYGDRPVTDDRERAAESALDALEGSEGSGA